MGEQEEQEEVGRGKCWQENSELCYPWDRCPNRDSHRAKLSRTWAPLLMLIVPLMVLFFFCVVTHSFINLCIHLIRGIFFGNCELHARHSRGGITGHCSLIWSVWFASSVKVGTETEMFLLSTSTRKKDVRILKKYHVSCLGDLIEW